MARLPYMFQSSPTPKRGCYFWSRASSLAVSRFQSSPTPRSGCYQAHEGRRVALDSPVLSSPTPRSGCYQRSSFGRRRCHRRFNPHPLREAGATSRTSPWTCIGFQSSPTPRSGCYQPGRRRPAHRFQSSPTPRSGCYVGPDLSLWSPYVRVSILTHSEKRVLPGRRRVRWQGASVSILTHSEKRVLPVRTLLRNLCLAQMMMTVGFNPHPLREAGATWRSCRRRPSGCFNPREAGATRFLSRC